MSYMSVVANYKPATLSAELPQDGEIALYDAPMMLYAVVDPPCISADVYEVGVQQVPVRWCGGVHCDDFDFSDNETEGIWFGSHTRHSRWC
jgi:hypothetical protein